MSRIRGKDTMPEVVIRKNLHQMGYRYRLHDKKLPGKPDIILPKYQAVILINGCFWHYHECHLFKMPGTRRNWWKNKLTKNKERDEKNIRELLDVGWRVLVVWECSWRGKGSVSGQLKRITNKIIYWLHSNSRNKTIKS